MRHINVWEFNKVLNNRIYLIVLVIFKKTNISIYYLLLNDILYNFILHESIYLTLTAAEMK